MPHKLPESLATYQRVFVDEFIYEWRFLMDVLAGRATGRGDFTDKLVEHLKNVISVGVGKLPLPGTAIIEKGLEIAIDWKNDARKEAKENFLKYQQTEELEKIRIMLELAAVEACKRYQYSILTQLVSDPLKGIIPLAKTGVERMLEYISRNTLPISVPHLVDGLLAGHSGAYVSGYTNTGLTTHEDKQDESFIGKIKRKLGSNGYTAEGVYGRSGLRIPSGELFALANKDLALHKLQKNLSDRKETWFNYGYTKLIEKTHDAKYGYIHVNMHTVDQLYGHLKISHPSTYQTLKQNPQHLSLALQIKLAEFKPAIITFTKADLKQYIASADKAKKNDLAPLTLLEFIKTRSVKNANACFLMYEPDSIQDYDLSDLNLSGLTLDDCSFIHCIFGGSLAKTSFQRCHLQFAHFIKVQTAEEIVLNEAQCQFAEFSKVNMKNSKMIQVNWNFADLSESTINGSQTLGASWYKTNLTNIINDSPLNKVQAEQEKIIENQQAKLFELEFSYLVQQNELSELANEVRLMKQKEAKAEKSDLVDLMQALYQEQQARLIQERSCKLELLQIQTKQLIHEKLLNQHNKHVHTLQVKTQQLEKIINLIQAQQKEFNQYIKEGRQLAQTVLHQEMKLNDVNNHVLSLGDRITNVIADQEKQFLALNRRLSAVEAALNKLTQEKINIEDLSHRAHNILKKRYEGYREIKGLFGKPFQLENQYINLQMMCHKKLGNNNNEEKKSKLQDQKISSYEDLFGDKQPIKPEDLFKHDNELFSEISDRPLTQKKPHNFILIQGRAGIGKTTFIHYVTCEWAKGNLYSEFEWVFVLPLRELRTPTFKNFYQQKKSIAIWEWIYHSQFFNSGLSESNFNSIWLLNIEPKLRENKALIVLEGLDETPDHHPCYIALKSLLEGEYASAPLIITSRPYGVGALPRLRRDIEITGFTDENIGRYIRAYFQKEEKDTQFSQKLLSTLKTHPTLWGSIHIPVNLNLICGIVEGAVQRSNRALDSELSQLQSMTSTYEVMECKLYERTYIERPNEDHRLPESSTLRREFLFRHYHSERTFLAKLAYLGMINQQIILPRQDIDNLLLENFNKDKFNDYEFLQSLRNLGIIKPMIESSSIREEDQGYEFMHLTFQEYYAGIFISQSLINADTDYEKNILPLIIAEKFNPRWQIVWWFVAGLLKKHPRAISVFTDILQGYNHIISKEIPFNKDLLQHYELGLLARCIEEGESDLTLFIFKTIWKRIQAKIKELFLEFLSDYHVYCIHNNTSFFLKALKLCSRLTRQVDHEDLYDLCIVRKSNGLYSQLIVFAQQLEISSPVVFALMAQLIKERDELNVSYALAFFGNFPVDQAIAAQLLEIHAKKLMSGTAIIGDSLEGTIKSYLEMLPSFYDLSNILPLMIKLFFHEDSEVRSYFIGLTHGLLLDSQGNNNIEKTNYIIHTLLPLFNYFLSLIHDKNREVRRAIVRLLITCNFENEVPGFIDIIYHLMDELAVKENSFYFFYQLASNKKIASEPRILEKINSLLSQNLICKSQSDAKYFFSQLQSTAATPDILETLRYFLEQDGLTCDIAIEAIQHIGPLAYTPAILEELAYTYCYASQAETYPILEIFSNCLNMALPYLCKYLIMLFSDNQFHDVSIIAKPIVKYINSSKNHIFKNAIYSLFGEILYHGDPLVLKHSASTLRYIGLNNVPEEFSKEIVNGISNSNIITQRDIIIFLQHVGNFNKDTIESILQEVIPLLMDSDNITKAAIITCVEHLHQLNNIAVTNYLEKILIENFDNLTYSTVLNRRVSKLLNLTTVLELIEHFGTLIHTPAILNIFHSLKFNDLKNILLPEIIYALGPVAASSHALEAMIQKLLIPNTETLYLLAVLGQNAATPEIVSILINLLKAKNPNKYVIYMLRALGKNILSFEHLQIIMTLPIQTQIVIAGAIQEVNDYLKNLPQEKVTQERYSVINSVLEELKTCSTTPGNQGQKFLLIKILAEIPEYVSSKSDASSLIYLLGDNTEYIRQATADLLIKMQLSESPLLIEKLISLINNQPEQGIYKHSQICLSICNFIKEIGVERIDLTIINLLFTILELPAYYARNAAAETLKQFLLTTNNQLIFSKLVNLLNHTKPYVREAALKILNDVARVSDYPLIEEKLIRLLSNYDADSVWGLIKVFNRKILTPRFFKALNENVFDTYKSRGMNELISIPGIVDELPNLLTDKDTQVVELALKCALELKLYSLKEISSAIIYLNTLDFQYFIGNQIRKHGIDLLNSEILKEILKDFNASLECLIALVENSLVDLLNTYFAFFTNDINSAIDFVAKVFFAAYLVGNSSCEIFWDQNNKTYNMKIFTHKNNLCLPLTLMQAQVMRRIIPKAINQFFNQSEKYIDLFIINNCETVEKPPFNLDVELLKQQASEWPSPQTDPLLADSQIMTPMLIQNVGAEDKLANKHSQSFSWASIFQNLQKNSTFNTLFNMNSALTLERKKKEVSIIMTTTNDALKAELISLGEMLVQLSTNKIIDWDFEEGCLSLTFKISEDAALFVNFLQSKSSGLGFINVNSNLNIYTSTQNINTISTQPLFWNKKSATSTTKDLEKEGTQPVETQLLSNNLGNS